jgi:hypothetical protein
MQDLINTIYYYINKSKKQMVNVSRFEPFIEGEPKLGHEGYLRTMAYFKEIEELEKMWALETVSK